MGNCRIELTLSTTITSTDSVLIKVLTMLNELSAQTGWVMRSFSVSTPISSAKQGLNAFSASIYAQHPVKQNGKIKREHVAKQWFMKWQQYFNYHAYYNSKYVIFETDTTNQLLD